MKEDEIKIEDLADTVAMMAKAIEAQNAVMICLLHKFDLDKDIPSWTTKEELDKEIGAKVNACVDLVRSLYGHGKTDKS